MRGQPRDFKAVKLDGACVRLREAGEGPDERGLARAVGAEQTGDLAGIDFHVHAVEHVGFAVGNAQTVRNERFESGHYSSSVTSRPRYASATVGSFVTSS